MKQRRIRQMVLTGSIILSSMTGAVESSPVQPSEEPASTVTLPASTVVATKLTLSPFQQPYALYQHDRNDLDNNTGRTALDRIDYGPGIAIQHTAPGQTSPFIRGLTGKQSLLLLDGVRLSHAAMRGGPNQYSAMVPDMSIGRIDVILGSSGVVTGSDGLTGALDLRLAPPGRLVAKPLSPRVTGRADTANGYQTAAGIDGVSGNWRYSFEGSYYDFHDRIGGKDASDHIFSNDNDTIPNTGYDQYGYAARIAYDGFLRHSLELAFGHTRQNDARRPDGYFENSSRRDRISRYYHPQTFSYVHLRDTWTPDGLFFEKLVTTLWWHQHAESQDRERLYTDVNPLDSYRRQEFSDRIDSYGIEPQFTRVLGNHELTYGALVLFERTTNDYREFRNKGSIHPAGATAHKAETWDEKTTITDNAEYHTYAIYLQDLWTLTDKLSLLGGLRYTYVDWNFDVAENNAQDMTGGLRASWQFTGNTLGFAGVSKAFRAPNLDDLDGATDRGSSGTTTFGNPDLDTEVSYTLEVGWRYVNQRDTLGISAFYTSIDDIIQRVYPPGGGDGTTDNGEGAYIYGCELDMDLGLPVLPAGWGSRLAIVGSVSYVETKQDVPQADGTTLEEPISRANRIYGVAGLRYELNKNWWAKARVRFQDAYDDHDVTVGDAGDVRLTVPGDADGTMPGYGVIDLSGGWMNDAGTRWVSLTLENLANKTYRTLGSGADSPGFNVILAGGMRF